MRTEFVDVDADLAQKWLALNKNYRPISVRSRDNYADDMINGRWTQNHQGIAFDTSGKLVDGQHRLSAIVEANKSRPGLSIRLLVARDVDPRNVDIHGARDGGTILVVHEAIGPSERRVGIRIAAVVTSALRGISRNPNASSKAERVEFALKHIVLLRKLEAAAHGMYPSRAEILSAALNAVLRGGHEESDVLEHVRRMAREDWTDANDPLKHLHRLMVRTIHRRVLLSSPSAYAYAVFALRRALEGKRATGAVESEYDFGETPEKGRARISVREAKAETLRKNRDRSRLALREESLGESP